jgi:hypothetical protein
MPPEQLLAWRQVQVILPPETPILVPTWLPASRQDLHPEAPSDIRNDSINGPMYAVTYRADPRNALTFGVGPIAAPPPEAGSGAALPIRGTTATLTTREGAMWLHWEEHGLTYAIVAAGTFVGQDDLPRIAARLAPLPPSPLQAADAWSRARGVLPDEVVVYKPGWMPERFGAFDLIAVATTPDGVSSYAVVTSIAQNHILFVLGVAPGAWGNFPPPDIQEKVMVLGEEANLMIASNENTTMSISWNRHKRHYHIRTNGDVTRDELLRIANSLAPVPPVDVPPTP